MTAASVPLGDGLSVSPLGFGGMALTPVYGDVNPAEALATLHHAVDAGVSFIDTADIYGGGSNEELIARLLRGAPRRGATGHQIRSRGDAVHRLLGYPR